MQIGGHKSNVMQSDQNDFLWRKSLSDTKKSEKRNFFVFSKLIVTFFFFFLNGPPR
jgi:hypothetical protein